MLAVNIGSAALAECAASEQSKWLEEVFAGEHWSSLDGIVNAPLDDELSEKNLGQWFSKTIPGVKSFLVQKQLGVAERVMSDVAKSAPDQHYLELLRSEYSQWQGWFASITKTIAQCNEANLRTEQEDKAALQRHAALYLTGLVSQTAAESTLDQNMLRGGVGRLYELGEAEWAMEVPKLVSSSIKRRHALETEFVHIYHIHFCRSVPRNYKTGSQNPSHNIVFNRDLQGFGAGGDF